MVDNSSEVFRVDTTTEMRTSSPDHHIDPGFINHRKIFSIFGKEFLQAYEKFATLDTGHMAKLSNDHLIVDMCLALCGKLGVKSLGKALVEGPSVGQLVCSTEQLDGNDDVWEKVRSSNRIRLPFDFDKVVDIEYSTKHIFADTTRGELAEGTTNSLLGEIRSIDDGRIVIHPLIVGAPTFRKEESKKFSLELMWSGWSQYEVFPEDIEEFSQLAELQSVSKEDWLSHMKRLPEQQVKEKIAEILGDVTKKDWGGELNDHYTSAVKLGGRRTTAAFLLKGPARFEEMQPRHLGKNADQIYRLSVTPANLLIVQHCHDIGEAVRATLRAFCVTPHNPRYYCFIDGKDTYRILKAYGKI